MKLSLDPENAAASIAARVETIRKCEAYIKDIMGRYDGLKSLETLLVEAGVAAKVRAVCEKE